MKLTYPKTSYSIHFKARILQPECLAFCFVLVKVVQTHEAIRTHIAEIIENLELSQLFQLPHLPELPKLPQLPKLSQLPQLP